MTWMERIIVALAFGFYVALTIVQVRHFGAPFGASAAPDLRVTGYTPDDVRAFLDGIGAGGRDVFFGLFRQLDTFFPFLLAMALVIVFKALRPEFGRGVIGLFSLLSLGYMGADLIENRFLSDLEDTAGFERAALAAHLMTQVKYGILGIIALCLLAAALTRRKGHS